MTRSVLRPFFRLSLALSLINLSAGCSSDGEERPEYLNAHSVKSLEVPPKLTSPDTRGALKLPQPSEKAMEQFKQAANTIDATGFSGARLKTEDGLSYLEIDQPIDQVWGSLPGFLTAEGIEAQQVNRHLGYVDTSWMDQYNITYGGEDNSSWFSKFSPDYKDKFRIRLAGNAKQTQMYVAHRGMQITVLDEGTAWQQRQSEGLLEREIMYRYLLYIGAGIQQATGVLENYKTYQPRASIDSDNTDEIRVTGHRESVWLRLQMAMDRLGVEVLNSDKDRATMLARVGNLKQDNQPREEGNWFTRLFSKKIDLDDDEGYDTGAYTKPTIEEKDFMNFRLIQQVSESSSVIKLKHENNAPIESGLGLDFRNALYLQLK